MCECGCASVCALQAGAPRRFPKMKIDECARGTVFNNLFIFLLFIIIIYSRETYERGKRAGQVKCTR